MQIRVGKTYAMRTKSSRQVVPVRVVKKRGPFVYVCWRVSDGVDVYTTAAWAFKGRLFRL